MIRDSRFPDGLWSGSGDREPSAADDSTYTLCVWVAKKKKKKKGVMY